MYIADWSQLQNELLRTIAELLSANRDYLAFRATCKSWRSAVEEMPLHYPYQLPLLMLPYDKNVKAYSAFSLSDNKIFYLKLSEVPGLRYCGSSNGWLVAVDETPAIHLFNPFTKSQIELPPITTFSEVLGFDKSKVGAEYNVRSLFDGVVETPNSEWIRTRFIKKAVVSSDPTSNPNYVVMAIHGERQKLAFCRHGDKEWTVIEKIWCPYCDIVCYKEQFYVVDSNGRVAICNIDGPPDAVEVMPQMNIYVPPQMDIYQQTMYLVESMGELLQVVRYCQDIHTGEDVRYCEDIHNWIYYTVRFKVFKMDISRWKRFEVKTLGDCMLFLGSNYSLSLSAHDFPRFKRNCIYFTDDAVYSYKAGVRGGHDLGMFNLEDNSITSLPCQYHSSNDLGMIWPPPIWLHTSYRRNDALEE
ncbi:F-box protein SKIP23-like [Magnolia sinica]|uniref:F-box protein SKIP23-like n=1 Tax=Magnolia sinica TaxID=86752 RepID=UPI002658BD89|nr:F-box protein SKIP23-like [Magnolia sinica]